MGKVLCIHTAKTDECCLCVAGNFLTSNALFETGFKFAFGSNKEGKVFGILSQFKKLSKSNDVHAQNKTFLSST